MSVSKGREVLESLDLSSDWAAQLLNSTLLTEGEKRRLRAYQGPESFGSIRFLAEIDFPEALAHSGSAPPFIGVSGDPFCLNLPCIGIVGTRSATSYGRVCAKKFAEEFARHGVTVVSGGAVGIDAEVHKGALDAGGKTVAVLANGVDHVYPSANAALFDKIKANGCLVSQFALGTKPADYKFILRNQLIAALCHAVVVIQAPLKSGAIRTAGFAAEMGREVFAVPGPIDQFGFQGSHSLIRDGATLVDHPMQVLEQLGIDFQSTNQPSATGPAAQILSVLDSQAKPVEKIVELSGLTTSEVLSELTLLELDGNVLRDPGGFSKAL
ncbi:MAG: DNA-processing protein DprA [Armatimonadota bacterium]